MPERTQAGEGDGWPPPLSTQEQDIEAINGREELLLRAHAVARRIEERVRKAMGQGPQAWWTTTGMPLRLRRGPRAACGALVGLLAIALGHGALSGRGESGLLHGQDARVGDTHATGVPPA